MSPIGDVLNYQLSEFIKKLAPIIPVTAQKYYFLAGVASLTGGCCCLILAPLFMHFTIDKMVEKNIKDVFSRIIQHGLLVLLPFGFALAASVFSKPFIDKMNQERSIQYPEPIGYQGFSGIDSEDAIIKIEIVFRAYNTINKRIEEVKKKLQLTGGTTM